MTTEHLVFSIRNLSLFLLPVAVASVLGLLTPMRSAQQAPPFTGLQAISVSTAADLETLFQEMNYRWPPAPDDAGLVPPVAIETLPDDFDALSVKQRKALFFRILAPLIAAENRKLREQRAFLEQTFAHHAVLPANGPVASRVRSLASRFNVSGDLDDEHTRTMLLRRVDVIPAALVMAQAANESGWGTSRFAREANNLFGMWTWDRRAGLAPLRRAENARHFVRVFENLNGAVANYLHTINVGPAYRELRELRERRRLSGEPLSAWELAARLSRYSARGPAYVDEIRSIIRFNRLHELPPLRIEPGRFDGTKDVSKI